MYGLGMQGMRPGTAQMMRPHNPLMRNNMTMGHRLARGGLACMAEGGSTADAPKAPLSYQQWLDLPTQAKIDRVFPPSRQGNVLERLGALPGRVQGLFGASPAQGAPVAAAPATVVNQPSLEALSAGPYAHGGSVRGYDDGGPVSPTTGTPMGATPTPVVGGSGISPLMQMMLKSYQQSQAPRSPFAPAQPSPTGAGAPGTAPVAPGIGAAPPKPFSAPGASGGGSWMTPQHPIQGNVMHGAPGQPIVPFMNTGANYADGGPISGPGGGHDDLIDAKLSDGEFVIPADVVSHLGDGSNKTGAEKLDGMLTAVRAHKATGTKFPPKAKGALDYVKGHGIKKEPEKKKRGGLAVISNVWDLDRARWPENSGNPDAPR